MLVAPLCKHHGATQHSASNATLLDVRPAAETRIKPVSLCCLAPAIERLISALVLVSVGTTFRTVRCRRWQIQGPNIRIWRPRSWIYSYAAPSPFRTHSASFLAPWPQRARAAAHLVIGEVRPDRRTSDALPRCWSMPLARAMATGDSPHKAPRGKHRRCSFLADDDTMINSSPLVGDAPSSLVWCVTVLLLMSVASHHLHRFSTRPAWWLCRLICSS
jgi:hypothetical protein